MTEIFTYGFVVKSFTLYTLSSVGLCVNQHLLQEEASLVKAE